MERPKCRAIIIIASSPLTRLYPFLHFHLPSCLGSKNPRNFAPSYGDFRAFRSYLFPSNANWRQIFREKQGTIQSHQESRL